MNESFSRSESCPSAELSERPHDFFGGTAEPQSSLQTAVSHLVFLSEVLLPRRLLPASCGRASSLFTASHDLEEALACGHPGVVGA